MKGFLRLELTLVDKDGTIYRCYASDTQMESLDSVKDVDAYVSSSSRGLGRALLLQMEHKLENNKLTRAFNDH